MKNFFWAFLNRSQNLFLKGFTSKERNPAIAEIKKIAGNHGFMTDFHMFSDIELSVKIEIEERKIPALYNELQSCLAMDDIVFQESESSRERTVFLSVTFGNGTGRMEHVVPAVPG